MRIVFFGTPEFAVPSLEALLRERQVIAGVVTQPDKPQGRSRSTLISPPIRRLAEREGIPILQPARPVGDLFLASLRHLEPELGVVVAYGHVLRREVLALPTHGMINEFVIGDHAPFLIEIPNFVYHGFKCVSDHEAIVVNYTTECYDYKNPDEYRVDPHSKDIPYDWARKDG